ALIGHFSISDFSLGLYVGTGVRLAHGNDDFSWAGIGAATMRYEHVVEQQQIPFFPSEFYGFGIAGLLNCGDDLIFNQGLISVVGAVRQFVFLVPREQ